MWTKRALLAFESLRGTLLLQAFIKACKFSRCIFDSNPQDPRLAAGRKSATALSRERKRFYAGHSLRGRKRKVCNPLRGHVSEELDSEVKFVIAIPTRAGIGHARTQTSDMLLNSLVHCRRQIDGAENAPVVWSGQCCSVLSEPPAVAGGPRSA